MRTRFEQWESYLNEAGIHSGPLRALWADWAAERTGYRVEREEAIAMLRDVCQRHGDNNWPDHRHLMDILEKHLLRHLEAPA
jgi:hypothetical protein